MNTRIISFEGIIGAGKSTTIELTKKYLCDKGYSVYIVKENVDNWVNDGILQAFYDDPKRYSYHFQTKVFSDKVRKYIKVYKKYYNKVDYILTERSLLSDNIFARLLHKLGNMSDMEIKHYNEWYQLWTTMVPEVFINSKIVYLKLTPEVAIQRIKLRNRESEDKITYEYQEQLMNFHDLEFSNKKDVIIWDASLNIHNIYVLNTFIDALKLSKNTNYYELLNISS